jgi:CheY-like chemotaxis protein
MATTNKILLLDDEQDLLDLYREVLSQLPSQPEIYTANSGARAIALLEAEPFTLLISDLNMPKMDGLQVLSIVKRKYPQLRIVVMTSVMDEQYRSRAYAMGVDLFWQKPGTEQEIKMFLDCLESLLGREEHGGFRGVQSKSLVDIIQLECLSQGSSVLKITNSSLEGRIWVIDGDVIDAATQSLSGEDAFKQILSWKTGNFEILPPDPKRPRTIHNSYQGLLLDSAQALDEAEAAGMTTNSGAGAESGTTPGSPLAKFSRTPGVEFVLSTRTDRRTELDSWGVDNPPAMEEWAVSLFEDFHNLGEKLQAGLLEQIDCRGPQRHAAIAAVGNRRLCVGLHRTLSAEQSRETMKEILAKWGS